MRVAYFDMIGGAAGDMIIAAMLDAGLELDALRAELAQLELPGYNLSAQRVDKHGITATYFVVDTDAEDHHQHEPDDHHGHDHSMGHDHGHHEHHPSRSLRSIRALISSSGLRPPIRDRALQIFERLGAAEARIHGVAVDDVHFHEVGAVDSIVDIVGAAVGLHLLGIDRVYCSPFPLGSGTIETQHGTYPIPAPATLQLIADTKAPTIPSPIHKEQVTPTGAAILTTAAHFTQPPMNVERVGYGAGTADLSIPNVLRLWIGELQETDMPSERLAVVETTIDDMNPELYSHVVDRALTAGALDAVLIPVVMKKGRPGTRVELLARPTDVSALTELLLRETSTLGVRSHAVSRVAAAREIVSVETPYGPVSAKVKQHAGHSVATPEYEDCRAIAQQLGVPLIDVYRAALVAADAVTE